MFTLRRWMNTDAPRGCAFSLAVMTTPIVGPVKFGREFYEKQDQHVWVLMTLKVPTGLNGKTLIRFDSDVKLHHNASHEQEALTFEYSYVQYIHDNEPGARESTCGRMSPSPMDSLKRASVSASQSAGCSRWW